MALSWEIRDASRQDITMSVIVVFTDDQDPSFNVQKSYNYHNADGFTREELIQKVEDDATADGLRYKTLRQREGQLKARIGTKRSV